MTPDPISVTVATAVLEKAASALGHRVLGRWSDYRARQFVDQFVSAVAQASGSSDPAALEVHLSQLLDDDEKSAALYDAFRHVFLSASREIGPRVLALHMAEVVCGDVNDPEVSDAVMATASQLNDREFIDFLSYTATHGVSDASFEASRDETVAIKVDVVIFEAGAEGAREPVGPIPLRSEVGSWALKLQSTGLLEQDVSTEHLEAGPPETKTPYQRIHRNIELLGGVSHLMRLTRLALAARDSS